MSDDDDIIEQVRAAREAFAAAHGYDVRAMSAALRAMDAAGDHPVVRLESRPAGDERAQLTGSPLQQTVRTK